MRAVGNAIILVFSALLLISSCSNEHIAPPHSGLSVDTAWTGDTIINF